MKKIHLECLPDEVLISKLGISKKEIVHHQGKSRVFHTLKNNSGLIAMVDEDPGSTKTKYENSLNFVEEFEGIKKYSDNSGNSVIILQGKLEDWIIFVCKKYEINLNSFGLPDRPNTLHNVINYKLKNLTRLIDQMISANNPAILKLKTWLG